MQNFDSKKKPQFPECDEKLRAFLKTVYSKEITTFIKWSEKSDSDEGTPLKEIDSAQIILRKFFLLFFIPAYTYHYFL